MFLVLFFPSVSGARRQKNFNEMQFQLFQNLKQTCPFSQFILTELFMILEWLCEGMCWSWFAVQLVGC